MRLLLFWVIQSLVGVLVCGAQPFSVGTPEVLWTAEDAYFGNPRWSPEGQQIAFTGENYRGLWVLDLRSAEAEQVSDELSAGFGYSWSPDGQALLTRVARYEAHLRLNSVVVYDLAAARTHTLTPFQPHMPMLPVWQAGGAAALVYDAGQVRAVTLPTAQGGSQATTLAPQPPWLQAGQLQASPSGAPQPVVLDGLEGRQLLNLAVSPTGTHMAFEVMGGNLFVAAVDGSERVDLGRGYRPAWSPDGEWVAFQVSEDEGHYFTASELYVVRRDGSERQALTNTRGDLEMNPSWSPDGTSLVYDSRGTIYRLPLQRR